MPYTVEIHHTLDAINASEWDAVVHAAGASIWYTHRFLNAYEKSPLMTIHKFYYLILRDPASGRAVAVMPATLQPWKDPMGVLGRTMPPGDNSHRLILLTHVWHCYDTWLPTLQMTPDVVGPIVDTLKALAIEGGAAVYGFVNIEKDNPLLPLLSAAGLPPVPAETRYMLDLSKFTTLEDYLMSLKRSKRENLRRYARRAQDAGVTFTLETTPPFQYLDDAIEMICLMGVKHNNTAYYQPEVLKNFTLALGDSAQVLVLHRAGMPMGGAISFTDEKRFHAWAGGVDYEDTSFISPYYTLFQESIHAGIKLRKPILEMGRRNDEFKLRFGFTPLQLYAAIQTLIS